MSDAGGKKVGGVAAAVAAIGMLFAKAGGSCAHLGSGAKLASPAIGLADDGARLVVAGRGVTALDDGALLAGRGMGALDDGARLGLTGRGTGLARGPRMLPVGAADDAMNGARTGGTALEETLIHDGADITLEIISFGVDDGDYEDDTPVSPGARAQEKTLARAPAAIPVQPASGQKPGLLPLVKLEPSARAPGAFIGPVPTRMVRAEGFLALLAQHRKSAPLAVIGEAASGVAGLVLPGGQEVADEAIHRRCQSLGMSCVLLACESSPAIAVGERESCPSAAFALWQRSVKRLQENPGGVDTAAFVAPILEGRPGQRGGFALVVSRLDVSRSEIGVAPRILRSRVQEKAPDPR